MRLYLVRDIPADESGPIFEAKNDAVAQRNFKNSLAKVSGNKLEYKLYVVGEIDHESDSIVVFPTPSLIDVNFIQGVSEGDGPPQRFKDGY